MRQLLCSVIVAAMTGGAATTVLAQAPSLQLTMTDGRVTILARDVTLRALLDEWSRVGQTLIVNADKLTGPRVTLQLVDTAERDALDILLRSAAGYIAAPRPGDRPGTSAYDRITILATSRPPAAAASAPSRPPLQNPAAVTIADPAAETDDNDDAAVTESPDDAQPSLMEDPQGQSVMPVSSPRPVRQPGQRPPSRYTRQPPGGGGG